MNNKLMTSFSLWKELKIIKLYHCIPNIMFRIFFIFNPVKIFLFVIGKKKYEK